MAKLSISDGNTVKHFQVLNLQHFGTDYTVDKGRTFCYNVPVKNDAGEHQMISISLDLHESLDLASNIIKKVNEAI